MNFQELGLDESIVRAVTESGYTTPTPIQEQAIPPVLAGRDMLGCAQTGTGKTGAFAMPMLHKLGAGQRGAKGRKPRVLVLCPTRELATQILESFKTYGKHLQLRYAVIFGGVPQSRQVRALRQGVDVVVATPGRLMDLMEQELVDLSYIKALVLDEADRMLDMGFLPDIRKIIKDIPPRRQTLLFSATMPDEIAKLADSILHDPVRVEVAPVSATADAIEQSVYMVARPQKPEMLKRFLDRDGVGRTLVFTRTKYGADKLVKALGRANIHAGAIHGNKTQNARTRALDSFKSGKAPVLIATDIASRGIDVDEITHVINYDIPNVAETYVHRIGRTARAGASGVAVSFCDHEEIGDLRAIERLIRQEVTVCTDEPDLIYEAPERHTRSRGRRNGRGAGQGGGRSRKRGSNAASSNKGKRPQQQAGGKPKAKSKKQRTPRNAAARRSSSR